ncbi:MAG: SDR family oxidoreductase, partial [Burkholderiales bacterium]|nr:SDR family oxidoreductase [Burkholderiales bacterium]
WAKSTGVTEQEAATQRAAQIPAKRFGLPEEFGKACAFLCSAHAGYITGQSLLLDGGLFNSAF